MAIRRWEPFREFLDLREEMDRLFEKFFGRPTRLARKEAAPLVEVRGWAPAVEMFDRKDELVVRAEIPGVEKEDIDISISGDILIIKGETKREKEIKEEDYYCCERSYGGFYRAVSLPVPVETEKIKANYKNGILEITLPKAKEAKPKKIEIAG